MNKYWNNKLEMPKYVKAKLKSMVKNIREKQLVTEFCINNNENIRLFKISGEFAQIFI